MRNNNNNKNIIINVVEEVFKEIKGEIVDITTFPIS